jgi:hypothetical protein
VYVRLGRLAKEYSEALETTKQIRSVQNDGESDDEMADEEMVSADGFYIYFYVFNLRNFLTVVQVKINDTLILQILLHELEKRCEEIKREADILENPTLRSGYTLQ